MKHYSEYSDTEITGYASDLNALYFKEKKFLEFEKSSLTEEQYNSKKKNLIFICFKTVTGVTNENGLFGRVTARARELSKAEKLLLPTKEVVIKQIKSPPGEIPFKELLQQPVQLLLDFK